MEADIAGLKGPQFKLAGPEIGVECEIPASAVSEPGH
jgi:hypothetical protein